MDSYRKEEVNTPPSQKLAILGLVCKINGLFTLLPHLSLLTLVLYKSLASRPRQDGYFETLVCHLLRASFPNKVVFPPSTCCLLDLLACHVVSRASLDSGNMYSFQLLVDTNTETTKLLNSTGGIGGRDISVSNPRFFLLHCTVQSR